MKTTISLVKTKGILICMLLAWSVNGMSIDDVIRIQRITAGDSYSGITPQPLISMDGLDPNPPIDLENTTYRSTDWWQLWHTSGENNSNAWLLIDLGKVLPVSKMYIWNMNQNGNKDRDIKDIKITRSSDSDNGEDGTWQWLGDYVIPQSAGNAQACKAQIVIDLNVSVRFIKIKAESSYGSPYWGLGKIVVLQDHSQTNDRELVALKAQLNTAKTYKFWKYTDGSWQIVSDCMAKAEELIGLESVDIPEITATTQALKNALEALTTKENLAMGAVGTADAFYGAGYEAENALDQNFNTRWATTSGTKFRYIIDTGAENVFNQVTVFETPQYAGRLFKVIVSVSNDGNTWTIWKEKNCRDHYVSIVGENVTGRYIKIDIPDCVPEGINVDEIMIFNDATAIESEDPTPQRPEDPSWIKQEPGIVPNIYQIQKADLKYGMFIHYGINTFLGQEWTDGSYPASAYNPALETLDPESWVKAAYEGGMNFVVLVTKHHEGFALWNTAVGTYNINHTGREGDKRDIVKEVADACKKYGIKLGLYYSAWDRNWDANHTMASTGLDRVALNQLYNDYAMDQITELMDGRYGDICEFWIDGSWMKRNEDWEFPRLYNLVKTLQPACQFGINLTIQGVTPDRMNGGENIYFFPSDFRLHDPMFTRKGANSDPKIYVHDEKEYYLPFEATICINNSWFWTEAQNKASVKSAENIKEAYDHMVEQGNTLVVNLAPGKNGRLNDFDVEGLYAGARALGIAKGGAAGVSDMASDEHGSHVYVDTVNHKIVLQNKGGKVTQAVIYDAVGLKIKEIKLDLKEVRSVDTSGLCGYYIVRFNEEKGRSYAEKIQIH